MDPKNEQHTNWLADFFLSAGVGVGMMLLSQLTFSPFAAVASVASILFIAAVIAAFVFRHKVQNKYRALCLHYVAVYGALFLLFNLIRWLADSISVNSTFWHIVMFFVSAGVTVLLASLVWRAFKSLFNLQGWVSNPGTQVLIAAAGLFALISVIRWISGMIENAGIGGELGILGLVFFYVLPPGIFDWFFETGSYASSSSPDPVPSFDDSPTEVTLEDGTVLKKEHGRWKDDRNHEWEKDPLGRWGDKGYRP